MFAFPRHVVMSGMETHQAESSVELLREAQSGDANALNQLLVRYLPRLVRWASGRLPTGLRTMIDTGDLVQDAIVSSLPHVNSLEVRSDRALWVYLKQAIRRRIIDLHRRACRHPTRGDFHDEVPATGPDPLAAAVAAEAFEAYEQALDGLTKEDFRAVVLRLELGLGYKAIAAELGKPSADAARMTVTRAVTRLAQQMKAGKTDSHGFHV
jgi:RNA polymerase sigma factor (sigma-70 family)